MIVFALLIGTSWTGRASVARVDVDPALHAGDVALIQVAAGTAWWLLRPAPAAHSSAHTTPARSPRTSMDPSPAAIDGAMPDAAATAAAAALVALPQPAAAAADSARGGAVPTLAGMLTEYLHQTSPRSRIGVIHRLDKDASGLLVFSKNARTYHHLKRQLFHRTVERVYTAVIEGVPTPKEGRIEKRLMRWQPAAGETEKI